MFSHSDSTTDTYSYNELTKEEIIRQWLGAITMATFLFCINFYLLVLTLLYEGKFVRANKKTKRKILQMNRGASRITTGIPADRMRHLIIMSASFSVFRQILDAVELRYLFDNDTVCNVLRVIKNIQYAFCVSPLYIVLWIRQRTFYTSPAMKSFCNRKFQILSISIIVIMVVGDVIGILLFVTTRTYKSSATGCIVAFTLVPNKLPGAFLVFITVCFQAILLGLFIHPLLKHKQVSKTVNSDWSKMRKLIKRTCITTVITILSDGFGSLLSLLLYDQFISIFVQLIYEFMLLVAFTCVVVSFSDWKIRLFPFLTREKKV